MHRLHSLLVLGAACLMAAAALPVGPASLPCQVTMTPVQVRGATYLAQLTVTPTCPATQVFRVRKSSTLNVKRQNAPYQPIKPNGSPQYGGLWSWTLTRKTSNIPPEELWSLSTWRWEYLDGGIWRGVRGNP